MEEWDDWKWFKGYVREHWVGVSIWFLLVIVLLLLGTYPRYARRVDESPCYLSHCNKVQSNVCTEWLSTPTTCN